MFKKVFEYAGPHKKELYRATGIVLFSVLMGALPFVLACQVISPLVLQALLYGWGLDLSHKAAYDTLFRLRTSLQKRFEELPLGLIQDKGTGSWLFCPWHPFRSALGP